jgi:hypothetical protein
METVNSSRAIRQGRNASFCYHESILTLSALRTNYLAQTYRYFGTDLTIRGGEWIKHTAICPQLKLSPFLLTVEILRCHGAELKEIIF